MSGDNSEFSCRWRISDPVSAVKLLPALLSHHYGGVQAVWYSLAFTRPSFRTHDQLVVNPEVSSIDPTTFGSTGDISIPGIKVRRAHTTVELRDGSHSGRRSVVGRLSE